MTAWGFYAAMGQQCAGATLDGRRSKPLRRCQRCGVLMRRNANAKRCLPCTDEVAEERTRARQARPILTDDAFHGGEPIPAPRNHR